MSRRHKAKLRLLHVINPERYTFTPMESLAVSIPLEEAVEADTQRLQQWADDILGSQSVSYSVECRTGDPAARIVDAATDFKADLIVMNRPGKTGLLQYVIGCEAHYVIKHAPCPVLTVPEHTSISNFRKILFPLRPVPGVDTKYELARTIVRKNDAHLTILGLVSEEAPEQGKILNVNLALLSKRILDDAIEANLLLTVTDSAVKSVLQQTEEQNADLIIITADRPANVRHLFIGPFYKQIISQAKIPVLVSKPQMSEKHDQDQPTKGATIPLFPMITQHTFPV